MLQLKLSPSKTNASKVLVVVFLIVAFAAAASNAQIKPMPIDEALIAANGIRKVESKHIALYSDARDMDLESIANAFDQAVPQWCEYFNVDSKKTKNWKMRLFLIEDKPKFRKVGVLGDHVPDFLAGYQRGHEMWVYLQPGNYYTRHLVLHEGTHAFMEWFTDGFGAPWYSEGMAELLGLHQWKDGKLKLGFKVANRSQSEYWGRIKIIKREFEKGNVLRLADVMNIPNRSFRQVESYAWAWAACEFLSEHPLSKDRFRNANQHVKKLPDDFNRKIELAFQRIWPVLEQDWMIFLSEMEYGYDVGKTRLVASVGDALNKGMRFSIRSDHGWQSTSFEVSKGDRIKISSPSRFQVGTSSLDGKPTEKGEIYAKGTFKPWPCGADGITIEYHAGRPLGMLMAGVIPKDVERPGNAKAGIEGLLNPFEVGRNSIIEVQADGVICLRINESTSRMHDNQGALEVRVEKLN